MSSLKRPPLSLGLAALMALPDAIKTKIAGPQIQIDGNRLDLDTQLLLTVLEFGESHAPQQRDVVATAREGMRMIAVGGCPYNASVHVQGVTLPLSSEGGPNQLKARVYKPSSTAAGLPVVVYFHGGGWVLGDIETHDAICRDICADEDVIVVSVDYPLAPEHPFPHSVDASLAAFRYIKGNLDRFGGSGPVAVSGDSAGANLAAVIANECGGTPESPDLQVLVYPVTDLSMTTESHRLFADGFFLTHDRMEFFRHCYLGGSEVGPRHELEALPTASPIQRDDFDGVAPAIVITAGFDPLRDEGDQYAAKLDELGVEVFHHTYPSFVHGFYQFLGLPRCRSAAAEIHHWAGSVLHGRSTVTGLRK